jgi:hypothetical protein
MMNGKECVRDKTWPILMHYPCICVDEMWKTVESLVRIEGLHTSVQNYALANTKKEC